MRVYELLILILLLMLLGTIGCRWCSRAIRARSSSWGSTSFTKADPDVTLEKHSARVACVHFLPRGIHKFTLLNGSAIQVEHTTRDG